MKVKVALIGAGGFGQIHLAGYMKNPKCKVIAISSRTKNHSKKTAEKFSIGKAYFGDNNWKDMLRKEDIDAVSICTPNYLHAPMVLEALDNNIHILCEKPICTAYKELEEVERALKAKDIIFFTSFQKRYNPIFPLLKEIVDNELLGKLIFIKYYFSHYGPYKSWNALSDEKWFFDSKMAGGGVLLDLGVHCIDILRYLIGDYKNIDGINTNTSCINMEYEDNCNVLLRFHNNILGMISVSWCNYPLEIMEIYGTEGNLRIDFHSKKPLTCQPKVLKANKIIKKAISQKKRSNNYQDKLIEHFINCIIENKHEHPNFEDGKRAVEFVLEAYTLNRK